MARQPAQLSSRLGRTSAGSNSKRAAGAEGAAGAAGAEKNGSGQKRQRGAADALVDPAARQGDDGWSESENEALTALRAATTSTQSSGQGAVSSTSPAQQDSREKCDWRAGLESLRREHPIMVEPPPGARSQVGIQAKIREALQQGDWSPLMIGFPPKNAEVANVVRQLETTEIAQALEAFVDTHESQPRKEVLCSIWIHQFLEHHAETVAEHDQARAALRQLLTSLEKRLGQGTHAAEALACLGKWRLISELAALRRDNLPEKHSQAQPMQPEPASVKAIQKEAEASSDSDEEDPGKEEVAAEEDDTENE